MNPSDSRCTLMRFRCLIRSSRWPPHPAPRVSSTGQCIFHDMPSLLPRESTRATSVFTAHARRPSPFDHRVGFSISFTRLLISSLALRPAMLLFGNSRPRIAPTPLPHATKAHGQLLGRDFNPLDALLLLRTVRSRVVACQASVTRSNSLLRVSLPSYFQPNCHHRISFRLSEFPHCSQPISVPEPHCHRSLHNQCLSSIHS